MRTRFYMLSFSFMWFASSTLHIYIYTYSNYINIPTRTAWIFIQSICSIHSRILPLKPQGDQQRNDISFNKITATKYLNTSKLHRYFFNVWIYQLEHLDLCLVSQGLTFKFFLLWVRASTGVGFWDPKRTREPTTRKKSNFYSDGFWLSKYVCIKRCNLILCFYIFVYTWGCIKSKRGVPETLKIKP